MGQTIKFDKVKDSGERQEFDTGSRRDTREGKGRFDLLPPIAIRRLAQHFENGSAKYGDRNWEKGQPLSRYLDSSIRHLFSHLEGMRDEDHLAAAAWNIICMIHTEEMIRRGLLSDQLDDLPSYIEENEPRTEIISESQTSQAAKVLLALAARMTTEQRTELIEKLKEKQAG